MKRACHFPLHHQCPRVSMQYAPGLHSIRSGIGLSPSGPRPARHSASAHRSKVLQFSTPTGIGHPVGNKLLGEAGKGSGVDRLSTEKRQQYQYHLAEGVGFEAGVRRSLGRAFPATMAESDFPRPCIIGYESLVCASVFLRFGIPDLDAS